MRWVTAQPDYESGTLHKVRFGDYEIGVRTVPNLNGTGFLIHRLGIWFQLQGRPAYTKVTAPTDTFRTEIEAVEYGVAIAKSRIDTGLA